MILKNKFYLLTLCLLAGQAFGQQSLTASEAVFIALENNYQIQISERELDISMRNNKWSEAGLFPTVSLSAGLNNTIQDNTNNPFTFTPGIILSQSINPSLGLDWNLFSGFQVRMSKMRLEQLEEQTANNALAVVETTIQDVLKAYYTAQLQSERLELYREVMSISSKRSRYYQLKEKYSTSSSLESLQFRNQYLTDSANYMTQQISYDNAMRNLVLLMNHPEGDTLSYELTDKIDVMLADIDYSTAREDMLSNNSNLKNQYIALELQKTNTSFQRSFLYPTLSLQAGFQPSWGRFEQIDNSAMEPLTTSNLMYYGNLNLRYTLFNNWKNKRAVEVSKIQEEISTLNVESMEKTLSSTLQNLIELYEMRLHIVNISSENLIYAQKAFELAEKRYELGAMNSIDLATFQNTYENTMIQHYENLFNKLDTFLEIYKMTGKISLEYQPTND